MKRVVAAVTAFAFLSTQLFAPIARAEENPLPSWLREEQGGWVPAAQAHRMNRADQELLAFLNTLQDSQNRLVSTSPSGVEALYADQALVVARDAQGNLLWSPALDDHGQVQDGTLLLIDGTLQTFRGGQVVRQVDPFGTEVTFDSQGRALAEIAADGTRSDYSYNPTTRTTHLPNGNLVQIYSAQDQLEKVTYPDGRIFTYSTGRITSATTVQGLTYSYSNDVLNTVPSGKITLPDGSVQVIANGILSKLIDPNGTQWEISAGWITRKIATNGAVTNFSRTTTPFGQQILRQAGTIIDRFSFDAAGTLYAAGSDRNLSAPSPFAAAPLASFHAGTLTNTGITATDGKYLYVKGFNNSTKTFTKVGTAITRDDEPPGVPFTMLDPGDAAINLEWKPFPLCLSCDSNGDPVETQLQGGAFGTWTIRHAIIN